MDMRGVKRTSGQRGASRGLGASRGAGISRGAGNSRGASLSRGVVSSRGVRGWRGKRGRGKGGKMASTPKDPVPPPADVPETKEEQADASPQDKPVGMQREKTNYVAQLLQSTIAMREELAKDPFLDTLAAESSIGGATERLNVFEQFKIPFDTSGKLDAASPTQSREKVPTGTGVKKTFQKLSSDAVVKKPVEQAQSSSVEEEGKEVFDSRELSNMCKVIKVIKVIKRVRGRPKLHGRSNSDISQVRRQSSDTSTASVTKSVARGQPRGRPVARGSHVARVWSAGHGQTTQVQTTDVVETFGRPASVTGRGVGRPRGKSYLSGRSRGNLRSRGSATFHHRALEHSVSRGQSRSRGRPRLRRQSVSHSRGSSTSRDVSGESIEPCDDEEPQDSLEFHDSIETNSGAVGSGGMIPPGGVVQRGGAVSHGGSSRRSSVSTECSEAEDWSEFYLAVTNRGRGKIRGNILWKYRGRGHGWLANQAQSGVLHGQRGSEHSRGRPRLRGRRQGRGRGRGRGGLSTNTLSLLSMSDDSEDMACPASATSSQASNANSSETDLVTATAEHPVIDKAKRTSARGCRARGRGRGGVSRGNRKTVVLGKRSKTSLLVVTAKKVLQESSVTASIAKILKKRRKKKKIKRLFTIRKKHTVSMKKKPRKDGDEGSTQLAASQDSNKTDTSGLLKTEPPIPVVDTKPSEAAEKTTEGMTKKKVKRKYVRQTNNSSQLSISQDGTETDTSSVGKTETLFPDPAVVNPKPNEPAERTTVETPAKVKRKYVRKINTSQLSVSRGSLESKTSSVARTETPVAETTVNRAGGVITGTSERTSQEKAAIMKTKKKYNWRLLTKKLAGSNAKAAAATAGKADPKKTMHDSEKHDGRRKKKKPKTLAKTSLKAHKLKGRATKKNAQGLSCRPSQKHNVVKQTNSGGDKASSDLDDDKPTTDTTNTAHASAKNNTVALGSGQITRKTTTDSSKTVRPGRKSKALKIAASDPGQTSPDRPPSPAGSCDSFSSNEPLRSLRLDHRPDPVDSDKRVIPMDFPVVANKDETDKKGSVKVKSVKQTNDVTELKGTGSADVREDKNSKLNDIESTGNSDVLMKDNAITSNQSDKNSSTIDSASADLSYVDVKTSTTKMSKSVIGETLSSEATQEHVKHHAGQEASCNEIRPTRKRRHYKRRSTLELLNDVDGPPSRTQRLMQTKSKRKAKKPVADPETTPAAETTSVNTAAPCVSGKAPTQGELDQVLQSKNVSDVEVKLTEASSVAEKMEDRAVEMVLNSIVEKVENSYVEKVESSTMEDRISTSIKENEESCAMKNEIPTAPSISEKVACSTVEDCKPAASSVVEKVESSTKDDAESTYPSSIVEEAEDSTMEGEKSTAPSIVEEVESCTAEVDEQSTPVGKGKKRLLKKTTEQKVRSANKGPRKKYKGAKQKIDGVWKQTYKAVKRKYKGHKQTDDGETAPEPQTTNKRQKRKDVAAPAAEDVMNEEKPSSETEAPLPKSYSVKRMTTRGKKNRYWYLFAKQTKMPAAAAASAAAAAADAETDSAPRSGSVQEMLGVCMPCRVMLVDFLKCLNISRLVALAAEDSATSETEITTPNDFPETTEPEAKVAKLDTCVSADEKVEEGVGVPVVDGDMSSLGSSVTGGSSQQTDTSSPSSSEETDPQDGARIPRTIGTDDPPPPSSRKRPTKPRRRFQCNVCAFKTSIRNMMDEHVYTHTNVEPYSCGHCGKAFSTRDGVVMHTRLDHRGQLLNIERRQQRLRQGALAEGAYYTVQYMRPKQSIAPAAVSAESVIGDGSRVRPRIPLLDAVNPHQPYYQCKRCTYATNSVVTIQHHVLDIHSSDRRLICAMCDRAYCKTEHGMMKHYKRWHPDAAVKLRYEPDYYEVWDVKEAEANGVDAATCTVGALPGAGGDASTQLHGQPLIGQPLIVQPGQTFLSQKALFSELPQVTQPLTLQPSVRTASKGRVVDENGASRSVSADVESHNLGAHPPQHSTDVLVADSSGSETQQTHNPAMPLLQSVSTYAAPPTDFRQEPLALVTNSSDAVRCVDADKLATGTDSTPTHGVQTLREDSERQEEEPSSVADVDGVLALTDDEGGSAGMSDTMPHLEKSASHEQSDTEEPPPLEPCVVPFEPCEGAASDQSMWPATTERTLTEDSEATAAVDDTVSQSEPSADNDCHCANVLHLSDRLHVDDCSIAQEDATVSCSEDVTPAAATDIISDLADEADSKETRGDDTKGDSASLKGLDADDKPVDKETIGSNADAQSTGDHVQRNGESKPPDLDGVDSEASELKGTDGVDDTAPGALSGDEMSDSPDRQMNDADNTEKGQESATTITDSADNSEAIDAEAIDASELAVVTCSSRAVDSETPPTVATSAEATAATDGKALSPSAAVVDFAESVDKTSSTGSDPVAQANSAPTEVTSDAVEQESDSLAVIDGADELAHSTITRQTTDPPLMLHSEEHDLSATECGDSNRETATTLTDIAAADVGSDRDTCAETATRETSDAAEHKPEAAVSPMAAPPVADSSADTSAPEKVANGSEDKLVETTSDSAIAMPCAGANSDRPVSPPTAPCSITDVRSLAVTSEPLPLIQCQMCAVRLRDQDLMVMHISAKHNVDVWFACPYCQLGCSPQRANIVRHIQKSHASQPVDVPINIVNSDKYFRLTTATDDADKAISINLLSGTVPTPVTSTTAVSTSATVMTNVTIGQVIMMAYHDGLPDSTGLSATRLATAAILPRTTVPASMTSAGAARLTVTSGVDLRLVSSHDKTPVSARPSEALTVVAGSGPPKTASDTATNSETADDDDIIFVKSQPASKRRLVAVRATLPPAVGSATPGNCAPALQAQLRRPLNVTTSLRHPIMSSVPVVPPAHTGLASPLNQNHIAPPNSYMPMGARLPQPMTSPVGLTSQAFHYRGNIRPAHMNNVVSNVGAQARPAHANHVPSVMRRGPPPLIPLTLLEAGRLAVGARPPSTGAVRMMMPGIGVAAHSPVSSRLPVESRPPPVISRSPSVINIADDDDDDDAAIKQSFSVFNLRPRLRTPSIVYRSPGGVDVRRPAVPVRAPPPPYIIPSQRQSAPPLVRRPPPAAHQFAPVARPTYNGNRAKRCPHCPYESDNRAALHDHIVGHGSIVRWACPYCSAPPQPSKQVIAEHIHKHHPRFPVVYNPFGV